MTQTYRQKVGRWGEQAAADYLAARGYLLLAQNVRTPYGEIDLIATHEEPGLPGELACPVVVFIEVKTRTSDSYGFPEEALTRRKQAHLRAAAQDYMQNHPELSQEWRVDVIAIRRFGTVNPPEIIHFENVIA